MLLQPASLVKKAHHFSLKLTLVSDLAIKQQILTLYPLSAFIMTLLPRLVLLATFTVNFALDLPQENVQNVELLKTLSFSKTNAFLSALTDTTLMEETINVRFAL